MFHNTNPTDKYVIAVDADVIIVCTDKAQATALWATVGNIEESPFGAMQLMAPNETNKNICGDVATQSIFDGRKIANADYLAKRIARENAKYMHEDPMARRTEYHALATHMLNGMFVSIF